MVNDHGVNLSDFLPNPKRLSQIFEHPTHTKEKWGETIRAEISGLLIVEHFHSLKTLCQLMKSYPQNHP